MQRVVNVEINISVFVSVSCHQRWNSTVSIFIAATCEARLAEATQAVAALAAVEGRDVGVFIHERPCRSEST